jgi:hypothetical protein
VERQEELSVDNDSIDFVFGIFSGAGQGSGILCIYPRSSDIEELMLVNGGLLVHTFPQFCAYRSSSWRGANREIHRGWGFWKPTP